MRETEGAAGGRKQGIRTDKYADSSHALCYLLNQQHTYLVSFQYFISVHDTFVVA
jgi:hypothetical protein